MSFKNNHSTGFCQNFILNQCVLGEECRYIHAAPVFFPPYNKISPFASAPTVFEWPIPLPYPFTSPTAIVPMVQHFLGQNNENSQRHIQQRQLVSAPSRLTNTKAPATAPADLVSDCALFHPLTWKMKPCRYYIKNKGWCPRGESCNFIHDLALVRSQSEAHSQALAGEEAAEIARSHENDSNLNVRTISGGVRVGSQPTHCWAFVQGHCRHKACQYLHPDDTKPYMAYTPCPEWPTCARGLFCPFRHPIPTDPAGLILPVRAPSFYGISPSVPVINHNPALPYGAYEVGGTTYFPVECSTGVNLPPMYNQTTFTDVTYPLSDHYYNCYGAMHPQWGWRESEVSQQDLSQVEAENNTMAQPPREMTNPGVEAEMVQDKLMSPLEDKSVCHDTKQFLGHACQVSISSEKVEDTLEDVLSKL